VNSEWKSIWMWLSCIFQDIYPQGEDFFFTLLDGCLHSFCAWYLLSDPSSPNILPHLISAIDALFLVHNNGEHGIWFSASITHSYGAKLKTKHFRPSGFDRLTVVTRSTTLPAQELYWDMSGSGIKLLILFSSASIRLLAPLLLVEG
jgi:hypothetical protein